MYLEGIKLHKITHVMHFSLSVTSCLSIRLPREETDLILVGLT